jgi:sugar lactone lactonase YvrE
MRQKPHMAEKMIPINEKTEKESAAAAKQNPKEKFDISQHDLIRYKKSRNKNIILGGIFVSGIIGLSAFFIYSSSGEPEVASAPIGNIVAQESQITSFDSEWFKNAADIVVSEDDIAYFSNSETDQIFRLENGKVSVLAGSEGNGYIDGTAEMAKFASPSGLAIYLDTLYVADLGNNRIRTIDLKTLEVSTLAGSGKGNYEIGSLQDGEVDTAKFKAPAALVIDEDGTVFVVDSGNNAIRVIKDGMVSTLTNTQSNPTEFLGDSSGFNNPRSIALFEDDYLLVADTSNQLIKKVNKINGEVSIFAGTGSIGITDGLLLESEFFNPSDIIVTRAGNIFISDTLNNAIRVIPKNSDSIFLLTGNGSPGFRDGTMSDALFDSPISIIEESEGAILIIDQGNKTIRRIR